MQGMIRVAGLALATVLAPGARAADVVVGQPAPDFAATDADGKQVKLSDFRGGTVVLVFTRAHW